MARLSLSLLGGFEVILQDALITAFESNKVRALLAYLAAESDRPHRREALATLLWPDWPQQSAMSNLRYALSDLRKNIGDRGAQPPFLLITRESIQLNREGDISMDVGEFEAKIGEQRSDNSDLQSTISHLQSAITLYRGEFMEGFSLPDSPAFEQWVLARREGLHRQVLQALFALAEAHEQQGEYEAALPYAHRQVALEPWHEPGQQQLMRLLALSGQRSAALGQFEACRQALADELNVEPSGETKRLYEAIRNDDIQGIRKQGIGEKPLVPSPYFLPPATGEAPFKGLQYFDTSDADLFFGREALTARLVGHIRQMVEYVGAGLSPATNHDAREETDLPLQEGCCFLAVVGASGSGKSSVVHAGVVPALMSGKPLADGSMPPEGSPGWHIHVITPTTHPLETLAISLTREAESLTSATRMMDDFAQDPRSLQVYAQRLYAPTNPGLTGKCRLLLVVDQFEELFTLCRSEAERIAFLNNLLTAVQAGGPTQVIVVLRADFYGHCAQYPKLRQALCSRQEYIGPMEANELRRAIQEPARHNGWEFEAGLVDLILRDIGASEGHTPEPGALPLLEHALLETWVRRSGRTLTLQGYSEAGGVHGAIAKTAEGVFVRLTLEQQALARRIFLRLTELGEGTQDTRRRAPLGELCPQPGDAPQVASLIKILADARLITLSEDMAEVAHEALIREWPALRQWLSEDREGLHLHRHLTNAAEAWTEVERDAGELYRGARLAQAAEWADGHPDELNALEHEFLHASQAQAERDAAEREAQRQRELQTAQRLARTQRQRSLVLSIGLAIAVVLIGVALLMFTRANAEANARAKAEALASARELASNVNLTLGNDPQLSLLLALQAVSVTQQAGIKPIPWDVQQALHSAVLQPRLIYAVPNERGTTVSNVLFSPDGKWLAVQVDTPLPGEAGKAGSTSGLTSIRDAVTGEEVRSFSGSPLAFSPDGKWIVVDESQSQGIASVKDIITGEQVITIQGIVAPETLIYNGLAFSPDGNWLAWNGNGPRGDAARLWDLRAWRQAGAQPGLTLGMGDAAWILENCNTNYTKVAFSPDGTRLANLCGLGIDRVRVWNFSTMKEIWESVDWYHPLGTNLPGAYGRTLSLTFSPNSSWIASGGLYGDVLVWEAASGNRYLSLKGFTNQVYKVTFSPDSSMIAAAGQEGVIVWSMLTSTRLMGLSTIATGIDLSPDGKRLAVTRDGVLEMWDITGSGSVEMAMEPKPEGGSDYEVSDDLTQWIVSRKDGMVEFIRSDTLETSLEWQVYTPTILGTEPLFIPMLNQDNTRLATVYDYAIDIWDVTTHQKMIVIDGAGSVPNFPAFSPDNTLLAATGWQGGVKIWDLTTGKDLRTLSVNNIIWLRFSPDGTYLAVGASGDSLYGFDNRILIWDMTPGVAQLADPLEIRAVSRGSQGFSFNPDGQSLVASGGDGVKVFDVHTGALQLYISGHGLGSYMSIYSQDGKYIVASWSDGTIGVYDAQTGIELLSYQFPGNSLHSMVAFTPDGQRINTVGDDGYFQQLAFLNFEDLIPIARSRLTRTWTQEECRKYLHRETCP